MVWPIIAAVATVVGVGLSAAGQAKQGKAAKQAAAYQAEVARNNAKIAIDYGEYNAAVARNNAISARYGAEAAATIGDRNAYITGVLGEYTAFLSELNSEKSKRRAGISRQNAEFQRQRQQQVLVQAKQRVAERRIETRQLVGTQRAQLAANGVVVDEGSAVGVVTSTYELGRREQIRVLSDADTDIFDLGIRAYNFEAEASLLDREAARYTIGAAVGRYDTASKVQAIQYEAAVRSYDFEQEALGFDNKAVFVKIHAKNQADGFEGDAGAALARGRSAQTGALIGAAGTILGGVGSAYDAYKKFS